MLQFFNYNKIIKNKNLNQSIRIFGAKLLPQIRHCNTISAEDGLEKLLVRKLSLA